MFFEDYLCKAVKNSLEDIIITDLLYSIGNVFVKQKKMLHLKRSPL